MPSAQWLALTALCIHYSSLTILMHLSRTRQSNSTYRASSAVVMTEFFKLLISIVFAINRLVVLLDRQSTLENSPHAKFVPQFESLAQSEEDDQEHATNQAGREKPIELEEYPECKSEDGSKWHEDSDQLIFKLADHEAHTDANSSQLHRRMFSSESYISDQSGKRKRIISGELGSEPDVETTTRSISDHSHRMSVEASPRIIHPSNRSKSPIRLIYLLPEAFVHLRASVFSQGWWLLGIPAVMFVIQNNLQYIAASNLSVPLFQITYQLKILTTALCSVFLLKRSLKKTQWISLLILTAGVAIVQLSSQENRAESKVMTHPPGRVTKIEMGASKMNQPLGLMAVVLACLSSGFASVYLERMFKSSGGNQLNETSKDKLTGHRQRNTLLPPSSIWIKNIQLSSFGLIFSLAIALLEDRVRSPLDIISKLTTSSTSASPLVPSWRNEGGKNYTITDLATLNGYFFQGFSSLTWTVVLFQVLGGILNSFVMKFSNNINKNFSICLSIILSISLTNYLSSLNHHHHHLRTSFNSQFFMGSSFVFFSTWLFNF